MPWVLFFRSRLFFQVQINVAVTSPLEPGECIGIIRLNPVSPPPVNLPALPVDRQGNKTRGHKNVLENIAHNGSSTFYFPPWLSSLVCAAPP